MKHLMAALLSLCAPWRAQARPASAVDHRLMLEAIAAVETGNQPHAVGKSGERGRCQFMPATWNRYTNAPFLLWAPINCELTRRIELAHLNWIIDQLSRRGLQLDPALIAAAWRHGVGGATRWVREDYAQRVANLYFDAIGGSEQ